MLVQLLRSLVPQFLVRAAGFIHGALEPSARKSYSQEGEDLLLSRILGQRKAGFFIDIGAHHPSRFSNTRLFYEQGWRGINIEPSSTAIEEFNRARPGDMNIQLGIAELPEELTYYVFDDPALNTFDATLMRDREAQTVYRVVRTTKIPVERLDKVLGQKLSKGQTIDFMSVDVEGFDLQVLHSNDWVLYRPNFVLVEALDFRLEQAARHPIHAFMGSVGYELVAKTMNTLFYRDTR